MEDDNSTEITALRKMIEQYKQDNKEIMNALGSLLDFTDDAWERPMYQKALVIFEKFNGEKKNE